MRHIHSIEFAYLTIYTQGYLHFPRRCAVKTKIYAILVFLMLFFIVVPPSLGATTATRAPFDYLDSDEQEYASQLRAKVAEAKADVATTRAELGTSFLQGYDEWTKSAVAGFGAIDAHVAAIKNISAPASFSDVQGECQSLMGFAPDSIAFTFSFGGGPDSLIEIAQLVGHLEGDLKDLDAQLDSVLASLDARINKIAEAQKMGEDILDSFLSCDDTST